MKALQVVCTAAGLFLISWCAVECVGAGLYQAREERRFVSNGAHAAPARARTRPLPGSTIGRIRIPRIGMSAMVIEGANEAALKLAPGHLRGTAMPGEGSNIAVAGHRDTFFRPLRFVQTNDEIDLTTSYGGYRYRVVSTEIVIPSDVRILYPTARETLTLVTCYPFNFVGAAPKRFVVRAECADCPRRGPE